MRLSSPEAIGNEVFFSAINWLPSNIVQNSVNQFTDFCSTINQSKIAAILLLFPDEFGIINQLFEKNTMSDLVGENAGRIYFASATENNMARSLHYQADEFLIEPISVDEIAKIIDNSIDSRLQSDRKHILATGDLVLNRETLIVTWRNKKLPLYPLQVHLLEFLMRNPNRPITRMELLNNIWSTDTNIDNRTIDRNIKRIRDAFKRETKSRSDTHGSSRRLCVQRSI